MNSLMWSCVSRGKVYSSQSAKVKVTEEVTCMQEYYRRLAVYLCQFLSILIYFSVERIWEILWTLLILNLDLKTRSFLILYSGTYMNQEIYSNNRDRQFTKFLYGESISGITIHHHFHIQGLSYIVYKLIITQLNIFYLYGFLKLVKELF